MNLVLLVCAVLSANTILGFVGGLVGRLLPKAWWAALLCKVPGVGAGLLYLYLVGYPIMEKDANMLLAAVMALTPLVLKLVAMVFKRARLIDD